MSVCLSFSFSCLFFLQIHWLVYRSISRHALMASSAYCFQWRWNVSLQAAAQTTQHDSMRKCQWELWRNILKDVFHKTNKLSRTDSFQLNITKCNVIKWKRMRKSKKHTLTTGCIYTWYSRNVDFETLIRWWENACSLCAQAYANIFGYIGSMFSFFLIIVIAIIVGKLLLLPIPPLSFDDNQHSHEWHKRRRSHLFTDFLVCHLPTSNTLRLLPHSFIHFLLLEWCDTMLIFNATNDMNVIGANDCRCGCGSDFNLNVACSLHSSTWWIIATNAGMESLLKIVQTLWHENREWHRKRTKLILSLFFSSFYLAMDWNGMACICWCRRYRCHEEK